MIAQSMDLGRFLHYAGDGGPLFDFERMNGDVLEMTNLADARLLDTPEGAVTIRISATLFAELVDALLAARGGAR